ncbi:hypothetical protein HYFRA_00005064 [Hymenoscyphus fraxineus]|uniref:PAC domain-containing protein n=1 Tax=Hymenoscyphus fraxineus TaxID=746836 RepID=A0A9N9KKN3_9HELO|nr:hypothetical protein HYFRA_00005064 [Hymenoscyphus fraxineus]
MADLPILTGEVPESPEKTTPPTSMRSQPPPQGYSLFPMPLNLGLNPPDRPLPSLPTHMDSDAESNSGAADIEDIPLHRRHTPPPSKRHPLLPKIRGPSRDPGRPEVHTLVAKSPARNISPSVHVPTRISSRHPPEKRVLEPLLEPFDDDFEELSDIETQSTREREKEKNEREKKNRDRHEEDNFEPKPPVMPFNDRASTMDSRPRSRAQSRSESIGSGQTNATSLPSLAPLQVKTVVENDQLDPLNDDELDPGSFDLVAPAEGDGQRYSLEARSEQLFSTEHLQVIFADPSLLLSFTAFMSSHRPASVPILVYYLDALKALKAIKYSNAIAEALDPIAGFDFTAQDSRPTVNPDLEVKASQAFQVMVREDLPAYITHTYIQTVSLSIQRRITGTLPTHLREASEGLAEVFCLTDPSRPDNPIVFASEEFHRTTQYGMSYVLGRNCRFLQGPKTNPHSVRRLHEVIDAAKEHCEVFLNYRRDGSPFMNLLMMAPLCDSRGTVRYFIGAQVDVSGLVKECADLESLRRLVDQEAGTGPNQSQNLHNGDNEGQSKNEFQELSEMLNLQELDTVRKFGGRMHKQAPHEVQDTNYKTGNWAKPRLVINNSPNSPEGPLSHGSLARASGKLLGIYENYLLVRPYPSLRILFASPSLRVPGILQSPFMAKIGGSSRVRDELTQALADGRGVTAKVRWVSKNDMEGRNRWIHCTPLIGANGAIGVWMVVIVDDENSAPTSRRYKMAPPVDPKFGRTHAPTQDSGSLRDFAIMNGGNSREGSLRGAESLRSVARTEERSASPYSLRID